MRRLFNTLIYVMPALLVSLCLSVFPKTRAEIAASGQAHETFWQQISAGQLQTPGDRESGKIRQPGPIPQHHKEFRLDEAELERTLAGAPMELTEAGNNSQKEITLPMPDGVLTRFRFVESPIMAPELAARLPWIKTYKGWGIDDSSATIRFDYSKEGFHAIVISPRGIVYITPLPRDDSGRYMSYCTRDSGFEAWECGTKAGDRARNNRTGDALKSAPHVANIRSGAILRTFDLAIAATAEYTATFTSATAATAGVITTVSNVTAIYERDLAISFRLVATYIYTDPITDPYTSGNKPDLLDENQSVMDGSLGDGGYDVAQVFDGAKIGGQASVGVVCNDGDKARGVAGTQTPTGSTFDRIVAHELGHQFGANHTFNGTLSSCGSGQRNDDTAYEPGSGSTIMAYPGACGTVKGMCSGPGDGDNLQCSKDDYFQGASLEEIVTYVDNCGGCAATSSNNNTPPRVSPVIPQNTPITFTGHILIPVQTPFALTASATDAEQAASELTFCWEDMDRGSPGPPRGDRIDNPLFRSRRPTSNPTRLFPRLDDILSRTTEDGETLPVTMRSLGFRITARDGHGGFDQSDLVLDTIAFAGPFVVTQPAAGTQALEGHPLNVSWDVAGTDLNPIHCANVRITMSTDNGATFGITLASSTPNDGSFSFTVPHASSDHARIKVEAVDNIFFNISPEFTIVTRPTITTTGSLTLARGAAFSVQGHVAVVSDDRDPAMNLRVVSTTTVPDVALNISNVGGIVVATATAGCNAIETTRLITLEVTNSLGLSSSSRFSLVIGPDPAPTLGTYGNATVIAGQSVTVTPSAAPSDPNLNLVQVTTAVSVPSPPPAGVTPLVNQTTGVVTIATTRSAALVTYEIRVVAEDTCFVRTTRTFFLQVVNSGPQVVTNGTAVRIPQGGESFSSTTIATVSDQQDPPGALGVWVTYPHDFPAGLTVSPTNTLGSVSATTRAECTVAKGTYNATLNVRDSSWAISSADFPVTVDQHLQPSLGTYLDAGVTVGGSYTVVPTVAPSNPNGPNDANNPSNPLTLSVQPAFLPGGGGLTLQPNGNVVVNTLSTTGQNVYQVIVTATDACNAHNSRSFKLTVRSATCSTEHGVSLVADTANNRVQRFAGAVWNIIGAGTPGSGLGQFMSPEAAVVSADGSRYYVADTGNQRIQWSTNGGGSWSVFASGLIPQGLVLDRDGNLYVADARDNLVTRYSAGVPGTPIVLAGSGSTPGRVRNPNGLAIDCSMHLYIADTGNSRVLVIANADSIGFPNTGAVLAGSGSGLNPAQVTAPQGVAVDNSGKLYVADTGNNRVLVIASAPVAGPATVLCSAGSALGQVHGPEGVTIAAFAAGPLGGVESIVVSDTLNSRIEARNLAVGSWMLLPPPAGGGPGSLPGQFALPSKIR
jgi:reprolysin-like metallo-peptidase family M12B/NHL repeat-containing protein